MPRTYPDQGISSQNRVKMVKAVTQYLSDLGHRVDEIREFEPLGRELLYHEYILLVYSSDDDPPNYKFLAYDICGDVPGPDPSVTQVLLDLYDRGELDQSLWVSSASNSQDKVMMFLNALGGYEPGGVPGRLNQLTADEREIRERLDLPEKPASDEREKLEARIKELEAEKNEFIRKYEQRVRAGKKVAFQPIMNYEMRKKFLEALEVSRERLDIESPWMNRHIINKEFLAKYRRLLERGVKINILYGIEDEPHRLSGRSRAERGNKDRATRTEELAEELRRIGSGYPVKPRIKHSNTHGKHLICDEKFLITGSLNLLSYDGGSDTDFRHEGGLLVTDPKGIREFRKVMIDSKL